MVLHLHLSPAVFDHTDVDLIRKATHPVYIRPYSSQCMSEQMRIMRSKGNCLKISERELVARHRSGQGYKNISAALKVP